MSLTVNLVRNRLKELINRETMKISLIVREKELDMGVRVVNTLR